MRRKRTNESEARSLAAQIQELVGAGKYEELQEPLLRLETILREENEVRQLAAIYSSLAEVARKQGQSEQAASLFRKCIECTRLVEREGNDDALIRKQRRAALGNLSDMLRDQGQFKEALLLYQEMEEEARWNGELYWAQASLNNQGHIWWRLGDLNNALQAFREQEPLSREIENPTELLKSLFCQALVTGQLGHREEALKMCDDLEMVIRDTGERAALPELRRVRKQLKGKAATT